MLFSRTTRIRTKSCTKVVLILPSIMTRIPRFNTILVEADQPIPFFDTGEQDAVEAIG